MSSSKTLGEMSRKRTPRASYSTSVLGGFVFELVGSVLMLALINFFALWYLGNYSTNYGYWTLNQKWRLLAKLAEPVDWLILGDSSCNQGVSPTVIAEQLGESAMNFCTIGNVTALNDLWMLEEYMRRFGAPKKGVVIVHVYDVWPRDLAPVILGQIPRPWGFWRQHTLGNELLGDPKIRNELIKEHFIPLLSQRPTLTKMLRAFFSGKLMPFRESWHLDEHGFLIDEQARPETAIQDGLDHMQFVRENTPSLSNINVQALQGLAEIADEAQLPIYLVNSPLIESLSADADFQSYLAQLQGEIASVIGGSESIHLITDVKAFPADQLQTADHLILPGAQVYTEWLVQRVLSREE